MQRQNAYLFKEVSPTGNVIEESLLQSPNVDTPTDLSVLGSVMESNLMSSKTRDSKEVIVSGRVRERGHTTMCECIHTESMQCSWECNGGDVN